MTQWFEDTDIQYRRMLSYYSKRNKTSCALNQCACGCGMYTVRNNKYVNGHNARKKKWFPKKELRCQCGCDQVIPWKRQHHSGYPKYLDGHHVRLNNPMHRKDVKAKVSIKLKRKWRNPEYRQHQSDIHTGYVMPFEQRKKISLSNTGKVFSEEHRLKISANMSGMRNHQWKADKDRSIQEYCTSWKFIGAEVIKEYGSVCNNPYCVGKSDIIVPHHIDGDKTNCHWSNLIPVCNSCNQKAHNGIIPLNYKYLKRLFKRIKKYGWNPVLMFE